MFRKFFSTFAVVWILAIPAFATDWDYGPYDSYDPGFYNSVDSGLYNDNDDWYYDNYTIGDAQQKEEDAGVLDNSYGWEADDDLFSVEE